MVWRRTNYSSLQMTLFCLRLVHTIHVKRNSHFNATLIKYKTLERNGQWRLTCRRQHNKHSLINTRCPPSLTFGRSPIPLVTKHKHLGLNITTDLKFHLHIKETIRKWNAALAPLYPVAKFIPRQVLKQIYLTYVRPVFDYGYAVYHDSLTLRDCKFGEGSK